MKKIKSIIYLGLAFVLFSCGNEQNNDGNTEVRIIQEWFANANFAGEVVAQHKYDSLNGINLSIIEGSYEIDPIKMVLTGDAEIGVAGADKVLVANDKDADLVVIGVVNPLSPVCFLSLKESEINSVDDFKDRKIGVLTGTATEYVYRSMIEKSGLSSEDLDEVEISFDLNTFVNKTYDVRPAFIFDEPVSLDNQNIEYNVIKPSDYNVNYIGTVYFCNREYFESNPELMSSITAMLIQGWEEALSNQPYAIECLKKSFPTIDENREAKSLEKGIDYFKGDDGMQLYASDLKWQLMADELINLGVINTYDKTFLKNSLIISYYSNDEN